LFRCGRIPSALACERIEGYAELLAERKRGEIKRSLVIVFGMFAALICICWGWLGEPWLVLACVFAWGYGDGAAALVGKKFGRHYLEGKLIEGRKTVEGTIAMFVVSFLSVLAVLLANGKVAWYGNLPIAALTAAVCEVVELYTRNGMDTLTCPFAAAAVILPLVHVWGI
jgi:dolichol kinase